MHYKYDQLAIEVATCPYCLSPPGERCKNIKGKPVLTTTHFQRRGALQIWRKENEEEYQQRLQALAATKK